MHSTYKFALLYTVYLYVAVYLNGNGIYVLDHATMKPCLCQARGKPNLDMSLMSLMSLMSHDTVIRFKKF